MNDIKSLKVYLKSKKLFFRMLIKFIKRNKKNLRIYNYSKWVIDDGEEKLLINYPLNTNSMVLDVGGYTGVFSDKISQLYNPHLYILEPVKRYYKILKNKYSKNRNVRVQNFGLSDKNSIQTIYVSGDGTSLFKNNGVSEIIKLVDVKEYLNKFKSIDLMSINIEGAEYDVLDRLIATKAIKKVKFIQIQFHLFAPEAIKRRKGIINNILKTHEVRYSYPFVWEAFERRGK